MGLTDHPQDLRGFSTSECTRFQQEYRNLFHNRFPQHLRTHSGVFKQTGPKENGRKRGGGRNLWKSGLCELYGPWNSEGASTFRRYAQEVLHVEQSPFPSERGGLVMATKSQSEAIPEEVSGRLVYINFGCSTGRPPWDKTRVRFARSSRATLKSVTRRTRRRKSNLRDLRVLRVTSSRS